MVFKPGESGNPSGRKALQIEVREQIKANAEKGVARLAQLLNNDELWHRTEDGELLEGILSGKEQIALAALAMDRGYGRAENVSVTHTHSGSVGVTVSSRLKEIEAKLPERQITPDTIEAEVIKQQ